MQQHQQHAERGLGYSAEQVAFLRHLTVRTRSHGGDSSGKDLSSSDDEVAAVAAEFFIGRPLAASPSLMLSVNKSPSSISSSVSFPDKQDIHKAAVARIKNSSKYNSNNNSNHNNSSSSSSRSSSSSSSVGINNGSDYFQQLLGYDDDNDDDDDLDDSGHTDNDDDNDDDGGDDEDYDDDRDIDVDADDDNLNDGVMVAGKNRRHRHRNPSSQLLRPPHTLSHQQQQHQPLQHALDLGANHSGSGNGSGVLGCDVSELMPWSHQLDLIVALPLARDR